MDVTNEDANYCDEKTPLLQVNYAGASRYCENLVSKGNHPY